MIRPITKTENRQALKKLVSNTSTYVSKPPTRLILATTYTIEISNNVCTSKPRQGLSQQAILSPSLNMWTGAQTKPLACICGDAYPPRPTWLHKIIPIATVIRLVLLLAAWAMQALLVSNTTNVLLTTSLANEGNAVLATPSRLDTPWRTYRLTILFLRLTST